MMMTPGTYLAKRREAAGLTRADVAQKLAGLPWAIRPAREIEIGMLERLLENVETDRTLLTLSQVDLMSVIVRFDKSIYVQLVERPNSGLGRQVCRDCACTWADPCEHHGAGCHWAEHSVGDRGPLCSRCAEIGRALADLVAAPLRHLRAVRSAARLRRSALFAHACFGAALILNAYLIGRALHG
jgi:hypothetical protein